MDDAMEGQLPQEVCAQLSLLGNSQALIRSIFLGLALQYKALDTQRIQIYEQACCPDEAGTVCPEPKAMQIAASLIILSALFGFQTQAEEIAAQTCAAGVCPDTTDVKLGAIIILVALIRLFRLAAPEKIQAGETPAEEEAQALEELELEAEPIV